METKRREIIERSTQIFMRYGIKSVTMDDVARELGISKKTLYRHFEDKTQLVNGILEMKLDADKCMCISFQSDSENAIDALFKISQYVMEQLGNINPVVFFDLKKYHPEGWEIMKAHKWGFILESIRSNIDRGIQEGLYRGDIQIEVTARHYVASTDIIMSGEVYPWPEYKINEVFLEVIRFFIRGMANEKGMIYLNERIKRESNV